MPHTRVFNIEGSDVSDGSTETLTDSDNEDWMIKQVVVEQNTTTSFTNSTATISVAGDSVTDQNVPIATLEQNFDAVPAWDLEWPSNSQFSFDWTNEEGAGRVIDVSLWVEPMGGSR